MSKSIIGKLITGIVLAIFFGLMIANNLFRAFDFIPYGTEIVFFGFFILWLPICIFLSRNGYLDWWHGK